MSDAYAAEPAVADPDADDAPLSQRDDTFLAIHIDQCLRDFDTASSEWQREAREAYDFVAGHQWSDEDLALLAEQNRPAITFNRTGPLIDAVAGSQVNNRLETRYSPRTNEDGGSSEILGGVLSWVRDGCDAEDEESYAFRDAATCGVGFVQWRPDYTEDPQGKIVAERVSPGEMAWDYGAKRRGLADSRWRARRLRLPREEVLARWPDARGLIDAGLSGPTRRGSGDAPVQPVRDQYARGEDVQRSLADDGIEVIHYEWCEYETEYVALDPADNQVKRLTAEQWATLGERMGEEERDRLRHARQTKRTWWKAISIGGEVVERGYTPDPRESSFFAITAKRDENAGHWYGLVRSVKHPQQWANKFFSQGLHIINTSANSGIIAEETAINDLRKFKEEWAQPGSVSIVADGGLARILPKQPPPFPPALQQALQFALMSINEVSGINKEMLGIQDNDQAGVLEWQRKQASQAVLADLFDAMRRYYKAAGRSLLVMVRQYISPDKVLRIVGPEQQPQAIQAAMVPDVAEYDIVVDQAPTSPNQKMETWALLQPMLPAMMRMLPPPVLLMLMEYSPLPDSLVKKVQQAMAEAQAQQGPPPEVQKMQAELQLKQQELQMQQQAEAAKAQMEMQLMREKHALEMQIAREKAMLDLEIQRMRGAAQAQATMIRASQPPATVQ